MPYGDRRLVDDDTIVVGRVAGQTQTTITCRCAGIAGHSAGGVSLFADSRGVAESLAAIGAGRATGAQGDTGRTADAVITIAAAAL